MATKKAATPKAESISKTTITTAKAATKTATIAQSETVEPTATSKPQTSAKKVGATTKVTFELPKEAVMTAKSVKLVGEFNNWDLTNPTELKKQKDGSFKATIELGAGKEYQYRFLINDETWENAWNAPKYVETIYGTFNSIAIA